MWSSESGFGNVGAVFDGDAGTYEGVTGDFTIVSNYGISLNFDERANLSAMADCTAI